MNANRKMFKATSLSLTLLLCLMVRSSKVLAQILPTYPETFLTPSGLPTIGNAMIECSPLSGGGFLTATVWGNSNETKLYLKNSWGLDFIIPIPDASLSSKPDVILGDEIGNPGKFYIAVICYQNDVGEIILRNFKILSLPNTLDVTSIGEMNLGQGDNPKIDVFADNEKEISGYPSMHQFVTVWNKPTQDNFGIYAGNVDNVSNHFYFIASYPGGSNPDVAAIREVDHNHLSACVVTYNFETIPNKVRVFDFDITDALLPPSVTPIMIQDYPRPRIEGMGLYKESDKPTPKWGVIGFIDFNNIVYCTNLTPFNPWISGVSGNNYAAAITAGSGFFEPFSNIQLSLTLPPNSPIIGNRQMTLAWTGITFQNNGNEDNVISCGMNINNEAIIAPVTGSSYPYAFKINVSPLMPLDQIYPQYLYMNEYPLALSTSCNTGHGLLYTWWIGPGEEIYYSLKLDNDVPLKGIKNQDYSDTLDGLFVYPNPVSSKLKFLYNGKERIKDVWVVDEKGSLSISNQVTSEVINVSNLTAGVYFLRIRLETGKLMSRKFVKE